MQEEESSAVLCNGYLKIGYQLWQKEEERRTYFNMLENPNYPHQSLYLRAIRGHSVDDAIDPELQDNLLLPKGFPEYIYHVGNVSEVHSIIINGWVDSRRKTPQKRTTSCVLHCSESDGGWKWYGWNSTRLDETKDRSIQEYLETLSKYCILVQFEARSRERLANLPRSYGETRCINQQKSKTKNEGREEVHSDQLHDFLDWLQDFREILVDESSPSEPRRNPEQGSQDTSSSSHELPMDREQKWNRVRASIVSTRTFRRTQFVISA